MRALGVRLCAHTGVSPGTAKARLRSPGCAAPATGAHGAVLAKFDSDGKCKTQHGTVTKTDGQSGSSFQGPTTPNLYHSKQLSTSLPPPLSYTNSIQLNNRRTCRVLDGG
jgi:hypothetical protein